MPETHEDYIGLCKQDPTQVIRYIGKTPYPINRDEEMIPCPFNIGVGKGLHHTLMKCRHDIFGMCSHLQRKNNKYKKTTL